MSWFIFEKVNRKDSMAHYIVGEPIIGKTTLCGLSVAGLMRLRKVEDNLADRCFACSRNLNPAV